MRADLGFVGWRWERQVTTALAKGGAKEKRGNAEARLCGEENSEGDREGSGV